MEPKGHLEPGGEEQMRAYFGLEEKSPTEEDRKKPAADEMPIPHPVDEQ